VSPALFLFGWGAWLSALAAMLAIWSPGSATPLLLFGGAVPALAASAYSWRRPANLERPRLISDSSMGTVVLVLGIAIGLVGTTAGLWLALVGGEIAAFGAGLLIRELRAMRRAGKEAQHG
jgi:hypothetical protein